LVKKDNIDILGTEFHKISKNDKYTLRILPELRVEMLVALRSPNVKYWLYYLWIINQ